MRREEEEGWWGGAIPYWSFFLQTFVSGPFCFFKKNLKAAAINFSVAMVVEVVLSLLATGLIWVALRAFAYYMSRPPHSRLQQLLASPQGEYAGQPQPARTMVVLGSGE